MQPDPKVKDVRNWFIKAKRDLTIAAMNVVSNPPIVDDALFHCQQAVEKSIKGLLTFHDRPFKKTHIIGELAKEMLKFEPAAEELLKNATELTPFATVFRYPGEMELPPLEDANAALKLAQEVYQFCLSTLPSETHP